MNIIYNKVYKIVFLLLLVWVFMNNLYLYIIFVIKNKYNAIINNIIIATINITTINRLYNFILLNNVSYIILL